jgi:hypothetical protein
MLHLNLCDVLLDPPKMNVEGLERGGGKGTSNILLGVYCRQTYGNYNAISWLHED